MGAPPSEARKRIVLRCCVHCGGIYPGFTNKTVGLCSQLHIHKHFLTHKESGTYKANRRGHAKNAKKRHKSPAKTLEQDLAWMYEAKDAFNDSKHQQGRRDGGAGARRSNRKRVIR